MDATAERESEELRVYRWRVEYFEDDLGYSHDDAVELALQEIDPHDVEKLIRRGCDRALAVRILAA